MNNDPVVEPAANNDIPPILADLKAYFHAMDYC
jgi:hypothetical protein